MLLPVCWQVSLVPGSGNGAVGSGNETGCRYDSYTGFYLGTGFGVGGRWYTLDRSLGPPPQENVSMPLSKHVYSSVLTGRQGLTLCHNLKLQLGKIGGGEAGVFGEVPPSRLNPAIVQTVCTLST